MNRWSTRWAPKVPSPHPIVENTNISVTVLPSASEKGFRKPVGCPAPLNGSVMEKITVSGKMTKLTSITIAWNTSVLETAMNPPMNVYEATAASVINTPSSCPRPKIVSSSFAPAISPEFT